MWSIRRTVIAVVVGAYEPVPKKFELLEIRGRNETFQVVMIGRNTEKSPGDLRRLVVTQMQVKAYQLKLMRKTRYNNNNDNVYI